MFLEQPMTGTQSQEHKLWLLNGRAHSKPAIEQGPNLTSLTQKQYHFEVGNQHMMLNSVGRKTITQNHHKGAIELEHCISPKLATQNKGVHH